MDYGILSIIPPIIAMIIAITFKRVALALLLGIFSGYLITNEWSIFTAITTTVDSILNVAADVGNLKIFLFTSLMGAFVILVKVSGGVAGFVDYFTEQNKKIKNKKQGMLLGYVIGLIIFIDGLLSIMFAGVVTRPITDKFKVSREKLAYICDSTSAPINALFPLNSWGAMLMGLIGAQISAGIISGDPGALLIKSIPFQFYSIISILSVLYYILSDNDWGPMKRAEIRINTTGLLYDEGVTPLMSDEVEDNELKDIKPNKNNMILPLIVLIGGTFIGLLITGSGNITKGDGTTSILYAIVVTLIVMFVYYKGQNIMNNEEFGKYVYRGIGNMLSLVVLLVLAFAIGGAISTLGTGKYLASLVEGKVSGAFGPAIIFALGGIMGFSTGTSWGTFAIMMPIAVPMAISMNSSIVLAIGAVVSGGIFGDHCSPLSDTTILSSMSAGTDLYSHFKTQTPYALLSGAISIILFIIFGLII